MGVNSHMMRSIGMATLAAAFLGIAISAPAQPVGNPSFRAPDLWQIDVAETGTHCVVDPDHVHFWRANPEKAARLRVYGPANAPSQIVTFAEGVAVAALDPSTFPISDGSTMTIADQASGLASGEVDFAVLPTMPSSQNDLAAAFEARGCEAQLKRMAGKTAAVG